MVASVISWKNLDMASVEVIVRSPMLMVSSLMPLYPFVTHRQMVDTLTGLPALSGGSFLAASCNENISSVNGSIAIAVFLCTSLLLYILLLYSSIVREKKWIRLG